MYKKKINQEVIANFSSRQDATFEKRKPIYRQTVMRDAK